MAHKSETEPAPTIEVEETPPPNLASAESCLPDARAGIGLFVLATLLYVLACRSLLHHDIRSLLMVVPDDLFYYLQIARHLAANGVSTFDGINLTNGYHPGWMLITSLCAKLVHNREQLVRVTITLAFVIHFLTALVLVPLERRFMTSFWSWLGAAIWLLNPVQIMLSLQGLETSLYLFALCVSIAIFLYKIDPPAQAAATYNPPIRHLALFGLSLGFACWARTEALLLLVTSVLVLAYYSLIAPSRPTARLLLRNCGVVAAISFLTILPWFVYSFSITGHVTQDSGMMKMIWREYTPPQEVSRGVLGFPAFLHSHYLAWICFFHVLPLQRFLHSAGTVLTPTTVTIILEVVAVLFLIYGWGDALRRGISEATHLAFWLFSFLVATFCYYYFLTYSEEVQQWYIGPCLLFLWLIIYCTLLPKILQWRHQQARFLQYGIGIMLYAVFSFTGVYYAFNTPIAHPWQRDVYDSQREFESHLPPTARIGCFNAGIPAYFSDRTIINLDGLVNHTVVDYWKRHRFDQYLNDQHIDFIIDEREALKRAVHFTQREPHLETLGYAPLTGWGDGRRYVWQVIH